ncbi:MAG TPA: hypothetical protein VFO85_04740, partial [Vicinamibacteria bacterium]|nr:hypothetical protein [Vicinamibacteria bacterium]
SMKRVPALLHPEPRAHARRPEQGQTELARLAAKHLPGKAPRPEKPRAAAPAEARADPSRYLDLQLDTLRRMFEDMRGANYRENFAYITARSLQVMTSRRNSDFGDVRLFKTAELAQALHVRGR